MQPFNYFNPAGRGQVNYAEQYNQAKSAEEKRQLENSPEYKRMQAFKLMNLENAERQQAMVSDALQAKTLIANGDTQGAMSFLQDRAQLISELGGSARETMEVYNALRAGKPDEAMGMINNFLTIASGQDMKPKEDKTRDEFLKETRAEIRQGVRDVRKRGTDIVGSYRKIESLLDKEKLTRIDISSAITSMARLISPGIVTDKDFQSLSNSGAPVQEIISQLRGFGAEGESLADALNRSLDPTNPSLFDKNAFMDTARRVISSEVPSILDNYSDLEGMATRANISQGAYDTFFGGNQKMIENLRALSDIVPQSQPQATGGIVTIKAGDRAAYDALPSGAEYVVDGVTYVKGG